MRAILISDHAKWCSLMMNKKKKVEVRKGTALYKATQKLIDEYGFAEFYVYCSKINRKHYHLIESIDTDTGKTDYEIDYYIGSEDYLDWCFDGKVAFKFRCYKMEEIKSGYYVDRFILNKSCLNHREMSSYLKGKVGCAIHISDLEIFDKPKELREFVKYDNNHIRIGNCFIGFGGIPRLTKAPQSFCYIEVGE